MKGKKSSINSQKFAVFLVNAFYMLLIVRYIISAVISDHGAITLDKDLMIFELMMIAIIFLNFKFMGVKIIMAAIFSLDLALELAPCALSSRVNMTTIYFHQSNYTLCYRDDNFRVALMMTLNFFLVVLLIAYRSRGVFLKRRSRKS